MGKSAIVLLSGGLDSSTCLGIATQRGFSIHAVSFDYGQRHETELSAARRLAAHYSVEQHHVLEIPAFRMVGGSALTSDLAVPKHGSVDELRPGIPVTYVPARNLVFLSLATAMAEALNLADLFIGVNAVDYSGYPDCRSNFIDAFEHAATLGTRHADAVDGSQISIHTPLANMSKSEIIRLGTDLKVPYELTHSCYDPVSGLSCGSCDSCLLRRKGFREAGLIDPLPYSLPHQVL